MNNFIVAGKIIGVFGINGSLKFQSYLSSDTLNSVFSFFIDDKEKFLELKVLKIKIQKKHFVLTLKDIDSRTKAENFIGKELLIKKEFLPQLENGTYYYKDLIGLKVFDNKNNYIGILKSIIETGANDIYLIDDGKSEVLVPAIDQFILSINLNLKEIKIKMPEFV